MASPSSTQQISASPPPSKRVKRGKCFLAVHFGAGDHAKSKAGFYQKLGEQSCLKVSDMPPNISCRNGNDGLKILSKGGSADDAVAQAMVYLENSKKLNAGSGSHLTMAATVENDAGFMSGNGRFAGVGAVSGVRNPCIAAKELASLHSEVLMPPNLLVGPEAKSWASSVGIKTCENDELICKRSRRLYDKFLENKNAAVCHAESDTIGAIALDSSGHVAACGSTGGGLYKMPGRVGPIAQYGCGIFACDASEDSPVTTAIAATGTGEFLTAIRFAGTCDESIRSDVAYNSVSAIENVMERKILRRRYVHQWMKEPVAGMIGLFWFESQGEFVICHNAQNMVYAYTSSSMKNRVKMRYSEKAPSRSYKLEVFNI